MNRTTRSRKDFQLPQKLDRYFAALSQLYGQEGERLLQETIVNGKVQIIEEFSYDNWNGGTWGHALNFVLNDQLFFRVLREKEDVAARITKDLNALNTIPDEFIDQITFEIDDATVGDWRAKSGLLSISERRAPPAAEERIWKSGRYRVFLSHKSAVKAKTAALKSELDAFGASCFVAHEDIHPTQEWQDEIENALSTADALIALLSPDFHESVWTNQEIGYALSRGIPIVSVRLGSDPEGFIGRKQALNCNWKDAPFEIAKLLIRQDRMIAGFLQVVRECASFNDANHLATLLPHISQFSIENADEIVHIYNSNDEVRGGFGFNGSKPTVYGQGLVYHLNRLTGRQYRFSEHRKIVDS